MPATPKLSVLYEDNHLLVLNKPAGLATMGVAAGEDSLWEQARAYLKQKYSKPGNVYLGVVSRLDAAVSGVIVLARTSKAAARLSEQFREGAAEKTYLALVNGPVAPPPTARLEHWMEKDEARQKMAISKTPRPGWKPALLEFRRRRQLSDQTWLLEVRLLTGRKHQIRAQLSAAGWPISGDRKYGSTHSFPRGIGLHSYSLSLAHPTQHDRRTWTALPPQPWKLSPADLD
ncbi:MAG: RluA family pseudouridine synthase [Planctomycetota bacterium]|jgi:23S rRNA pseudouridine1911/1915/1917 synthase